MSANWLSDLKLAIKFLRSIQTENHQLNYELEIIAREIDDLMSRLEESASNKKSSCEP